ELDGIANRTQFNGKTLLDGTFAAPASGASGTSGTSGASGAGQKLVFQIGANANQTLELHVASMKAADLGSVGASGGLSIEDIDVTNFIEAAAASGASGTSGTSGAAGSQTFEQVIAAIDAAIKQVSEQRSLL